MLRLYTLWELEREVSPDEFQHILTPEAALKKSAYCYDLDYRNYTSPPINEAPRPLDGLNNKPYQRTGYDPIYDDLEINLMEGWIIGLDTDEPWDETVNPFHISADGELIFDNADPFCWVVSDFQRAFRLAISNQNGRKPAATEKFQSSGEPVQYAQVAKTINTKAAGRLLAAGGIYNGNIEGFRQTAEQLGGDAPAGYDQVMDNKGLLITAASVAAGLTMGKINVAGEPEELSSLSKIPTFESPVLKGFTSESGALLNAEHAVVDYRKLATYSLDVNHPVGGHKARVFESALGYNPTNSDVLGSRVQEGILTAPAKVLEANQHGQRMAVDMPILGANGETVIVRSGWIYEPDAVVPRMTTIFVK
ncbi:hypothetical protein OSH03_06655 [Enterobacter sp. E-TC7]|uniref:Uncharacterized protein n=1 Tax=Enterobacter nematophilus TaxID=2994648 RepID=A0ABT3VV56_9ENTR|nr:DUF6883 domain-containing protein [Enterobacter nematophilus]MCX5573646.1 hypothetical protein [Enterobacter nematophilus]